MEARTVEANCSRFRRETALNVKIPLTGILLRVCYINRVNVDVRKICLKFPKLSDFIAGAPEYLTVNSSGPAGAEQYYSTGVFRLTGETHNNKPVWSRHEGTMKLFFDNGKWNNSILIKDYSLKIYYRGALDDVAVPSRRQRRRGYGGTRGRSVASPGHILEILEWRLALWSSTDCHW